MDSKRQVPQNKQPPTDNLGSQSMVIAPQLQAHQLNNQAFHRLLAQISQIRVDNPTPAEAVQAARAQSQAFAEAQVHARALAQPRAAQAQVGQAQVAENQAPEPPLSPSILFAALTLTQMSEAEYFTLIVKSKCPLCGHASGLVEQALSHYKIQHNMESSSYNCPLCNYPSETMTSAQQHFEKFHSRGTTASAFTCLLCNDSCENAVAARVHYGRNHYGSNRKFCCPACDHSRERAMPAKGMSANAAIQHYQAHRPDDFSA